MKKILLVLALVCWGVVKGEKIEIPVLPQSHPRYLTTADKKEETVQMIRSEAWAKEVFEKLKEQVNFYADREPEWLVSRLQMYWNSHATEVYIKGMAFSHTGGDRASAPTVRFTGTRAATTIYSRPALEDIPPYSEDERGILVHNKTKEGHPLEWAEPVETARIIEGINREIMSIARDAAFLYWITGEEKYGSLAREVFDTYMTGIYYRNVPVDLEYGHQQTLVSMSSFEVIHEDILKELVPLYDFMYDDLKSAKAEKMDIYVTAFKKWADNIIDNGVPHNNWNLMQAKYIMDIGLILEDDDHYPDRKGRQYYIDYVLNQSSIRQWSLFKLMEYGFDLNTGIWAESPSYSLMVVADFAEFVELIDHNLHMDILPQMPVIPKGVAASPQYLFPNRLTVGFGDTHPGALRTDFMRKMIANAQRYGKREQEIYFTRMLKLFEPESAVAPEEKKNVRVAVKSFFTDKPLVLDPSIPAGTIEEYVSPLFYAPNVSWLVQRNGMDPQNSLMISLIGSEGNHMHANGISMELYGKGLPLAPDAGIGTGYFAQDYAEYYGQFPAHNTVCVDGISSYPIMKSNHGFEVRSMYPASGEKEGVYPGVTYSDILFREPETRADQNRLMSIVTTGEKTGYYVDIFRSRKERGGDKMHDYFYHNMGQEMKLTAINGEDLDLHPTEELAFAGAHLGAYSYIYNKKSAETNKDVNALFIINMPDGNDIYMNMWMKGEKDRKVFTALSPMTEGLSRTPGMPYNIKEQPTLTFVARQQGEAWTRPFIAIFEPSSKDEPSAIEAVSFFEADTEAEDFAGICVRNRSGRTDYIFSQSSTDVKATYKGITVQGSYGLAGEKDAKNRMLFLGNGKYMATSDITIEAEEAANITVECKAGKWYYTTDKPCTIKIGKKVYKVNPSGYKSL